jgi:hypothetical protein
VSNKKTATLPFTHPWFIIMARFITKTIKNLGGLKNIKHRL